MTAARGVLLAVAALAACGGSPAPPPAPPAARPAPPASPPPKPAPPANGISLKVTPPDAVVSIDDEPPQPASALPEIVALKPGIHQLVITKDGYKAYRVEFSIVSGKTETFGVQLEPARP
ncbi:MAG: hypothetical protein ACM31C_24055 [Acidobacteriota bacterium]